MPDPEREREPWYLRYWFPLFTPLGVAFAFGWFILIWANHLPSYLEVLSLPLFFFGAMGVPLILGERREKAVKRENEEDAYRSALGLPDMDGYVGKFFCNRCRIWSSDTCCTRCGRQIMP